MANKSFGVREINIIGAAGTPTIESPGVLNINATNVAISTNVSIGGTVTASFFVGDGSKLINVPDIGASSQWVTTVAGIHTTSNVGIGTTNPTSKLHVVGNISVSGIITASDFNSNSDENLKTNINLIENSLDKILQIRGVNFEWKETHNKSAGVIAQEVEKVLPELVSCGEYKTVNYNGIIGVLVEAIKELKNEVEELKKKVQ